MTNPVLDHLLELRATIVRAMRNPNMPADIYSMSRDRIKELDATLTGMGYDVSKEVQLRMSAPKHTRKVSRKVERTAKKRAGNSFTERINRHFAIKRSEPK